MFDRKAYMKAYMKRYQQEHKEALKQYHKEYCLAHKDSLAEKQAQYDKEHATERAVYKQVWQRRNSTRANLSKILWYRNNRERVIASNKRYQQTPQYKLWARVRSHNRRTALQTLTIETVQQVYEENIKKYGTLTCELCFKPIVFGQDSIEHFHPLSRLSEYTGGDINERSNLGVAHDGAKSAERCNLRKFNKTLDEWFAIKPKGDEDGNIG